MAKLVLRTLEAFSVHGHVQPGSVDEDVLAYGEFFDQLKKSDLRTLRYTFGSDTVAISDVSDGNGLLAFRFVVGSADEIALVYDTGTATVSELDTGEDRFIVNGAWVVVDKAERVLILEKKRPGLPVYLLERFLAKFGEEQLRLGGLAISINPIPSAGFVQEIESFTRIREASITLRRPNHSWTKTAEGLLGNLPESNAEEVQVQLKASRGQSLSKSEGVVMDVMQLASNPISALKNAVVKGESPEYEGEKSVSLQKHTIKGTTRLDPSEGPHKQLDKLRDLATKLIGQVVSGIKHADIRLALPSAAEPQEAPEVERGDANGDSEAK
ncbi:hypothetical protein [Agreia sp. Leaf335]|uniref:hypothetical protein n=1 Tax=Agreia sp. Leaf335 TaxID=1736340 RepID=UPI0012E0DEE9|nr:hypothetical protein [Agreia sp. Leaf335]